MTEAMDILTAIRGSQARYFSNYGQYAASLASLDFDASSISLMGSLKYFRLDPTQVMCAPAGSTLCTDDFIARIRRDSSQEFSTMSGCVSGYEFQVYKSGLAALNCQVPGG